MIAAGACALLGGPVALAAPDAPAPSRARLRAFECRTALDPASRLVSVQAVMRPVPGTAAMQLRFELLERPAGAGPFSPVRGGDLGTWVSPSDATLGRRSGDVWIFNHPVRDLAAPAVYRFRVTFRWLGTGGRRLAEVQRTSRTCRQPELRPDPSVDSIAITPVPGHPKQAQYRVTIANRGARPVGPLQLTFAPADGLQVRRRTISRVGAHRTLTETFTGRACAPATAPTVTVAVQQPLDDLDPGDDTLSVPASCPELTTAGTR